MYLGIDHVVGYSADIRPRDLVAWEGHLVVATETETYSFQVGSMHPTGMLSCLLLETYRTPPMMLTSGGY